MYSAADPHASHAAEVQPIADDDTLWSVEEAEIQEQNSKKGTAAHVHRANGRVGALEAEAAAKGYGKFYAAFGGGRDGLTACRAGADSCPCLTDL